MGGCEQVGASVWNSAIVAYRCTFNLVGAQLDVQRARFGYPRLALKRPVVLCPIRYLEEACLAIFTK